MTPAAPGETGRHAVGPRVALWLCILATAALAVYAAVRGLAPAPARVLVTAQDCLRAYDEPQCKAMVDKALSLHDSTAPSFTERSTCVLMLGDAACRPVNEGGVETARFGPPLVAILVGRSTDDLLPLYYGADDRRAPTGGRSVYFHGHYIGSLTSSSFGGADLPQVIGSDGQPITAAAVGRLRAH